MQLKKEFLKIDSEHYIIYLSSHRGAELPPIPNFYDIADIQEGESLRAVPEVLPGMVGRQKFSPDTPKGMSIAKQAIGLYVACDEVDFPVCLELWDTPPQDVDPNRLNDWFYVAEVSFDLSHGELYIHGLMDHDSAKPIYIAPDTYRIRVYLGSLDRLDEDYVYAHWSITEDEYEEDYRDEDDLEDVGSRLYDPERNVWCRLVLWPSAYSLPQAIVTPSKQNS